MARVDALDSTPHPITTPKPHSQVQHSRTPPNSTSDIEMTDNCDFNKAEFKPLSADNSATECATVDSATDKALVKRGPHKKLNTWPIKKGAKWLVDNESEDQELKMMLDSEVDQHQKPKPKKAKVKVRNEINIATKKIDKNISCEYKNGRMVKSMASGNEELREDPAPRSRKDGENQVITGNKRKKLMREGAIANLLDGEITKVSEHSGFLINT